MKAIYILNGLVSVVALALTAIYGRLHWWYRGVRRDGLQASVGSELIANLDAISGLAVTLALLSLIIALLLRVYAPLSKRWIVASITLSVTCFLFSVLTVF